MNLNRELVSISDHIPASIRIYSYETSVEHWHPETELLFILYGQADIIIEDRAWNLNTEDICLINSNSVHQVIPHQCQALSVRFRPEALKMPGDAEEFYYELNSSGQTSSHRYHYVRYLIAQLVRVNASGENAYMTLSLLYALVSHLNDSFRIPAPPGSNTAARLRGRMSEILQYIDSHYRDGITLAELAEAQHLTVPYLATFFEKKMGMTFLTYYNSIRLTRAVNQMLSSDAPLEKIALDNGFRDSRSFVALFKKKYRCLPSVYRREYKSGLRTQATAAPGISGSGMTSQGSDCPRNTLRGEPIPGETSCIDDLSALAKYLNYYYDAAAVHLGSEQAALIMDAGTVDCAIEGISLKHTFHTMCCVGSARLFLYAEVQDMVRRMQKDIGYRYVKFHGILSDEMMVYMEDRNGRPLYSFTMVDKVIDFLMEVGLKPLVQLSFMPQALASDPDKLIDMWHFNTSPPKSMKKWNDLVHALLTHLISRYGQSEVRSWLFCVWNEPDGAVESFGWKDADQFYRFFKETYDTVKAVDSRLHFGTPSLLIGPGLDQQWTMDFFRYSIEHNCVSDFLNIHYYDNSFSPDINDSDRFSLDNLSWNKAPLNEDPFAFTKFINSIKYNNKRMKMQSMPVYLTEWNLTVSHRDLINDTCFKSCYLIKNLLENYDRLESFGYWCLTDFIEELQLPNALFHGGLGMMTYNGIPKAHYNTFKFLTALGDTLIAKGNGYFVTRKVNHIVMILYNYEHFSKLFASGILFDMTSENRYAPFIQKSRAQFRICFEYVDASRCLIKEQFVNQEKGSSYDIWVRMGAQPLTTPDTLEFLRQEARPGMYLHSETITDGTLSLSLELEPLEVRLVDVELMK